MTPALLTRVGLFLYGASWKKPLSRALGRSDRTIRRWLDGKHRMPADLRERAKGLLAGHRRTLEEIEEQVEQGRDGVTADDQYIELVIRHANGDEFTFGMMESVLRYQPSLARERLNRGIKIETKALELRETERLASARLTTRIIDSRDGSVIWQAG